MNHLVIDAEFRRLVKELDEAGDLAGSVMLEEVRSCWHVIGGTNAFIALEAARNRLAACTGSGPSDG